METKKKFRSISISLIGVCFLLLTQIKVSASENPQISDAVSTLKSSGETVNSTSIYLVRRGANTPDVFFDYNSNYSWHGNLHLGNGAKDTLRPDVEFFLNKLFVVHRGRTSNNIFISSTSDGYNYSPDLYLGNGAQTTTCPRVVAFKNKLFVFHKGKSTNHIHYNYSYNGSTWYGSYHLGNGAKTSASPEVIVFNNKIYLFHKGSSTNHIFVCSSSDGINWSADLHLGNGAKTDDVHGLAATVFNNKIYLFHKGVSSDNIFVCSSSDGSNWSADLYLGNGAQTSSAPAAAVDDNRIYVFHKGKSTNDIHYNYSYNGSTWYGSFHLGNGAKSATGPSACEYDFNTINGSATGNSSLSLTTSNKSGTKNSKNSKSDNETAATSILYPNPVYDFVNIDASQVVEKIEIYNVSGKNVKVCKPNSSQYKMDLSMFLPGSYTIRLYYSDAVENKKLIIQR